ncbi:MAG: DUF58 domain-containing protein [Myxococcota bacterium]
MLPSRISVLLAIVPLVLGIAAAADASFIGPMLAADLGLLLALGVDAALARRRWIDVQRSVGTGVFSIGRPNVVTLELRSRAPQALELQVTDDVFDGAEAEGLPAQVQLGPHGRATVQYRVIPSCRGAYELGDHWIRHRSPLGLWVRQVRIAARDEVRVYPDIQKIRAYDMLAQQDPSWGMSAVARSRGGESEFESLREYTRDDEFRSIDWRATARRRKLIARQYQLERDQSVVFALDCGRLMTAHSGGLPLLDHALNAALMLSHVAIRRGDHAGLFAFSDAVHRFVAPGAGPSMVRRLLRSTFDLHARETESDYEGALLRMDGLLRKRCLLVLVTQVSDETGAQALLRTVQGLGRRHLPLCVLLRDPDLEAMARPAERSMTAMYDAAAAAELLTERSRLMQQLERAGAMVLDVESSQVTPEVVRTYLEVKARHLL